MISITELMEKKTPSIKKYDKKKGMTLVEIMAAMAILSILFVAISSFMLNLVKSENRSNSYLNTTNYLKAALEVFELKAGGDITDSSDSRQYYIEKDKFELFIDKEVYIYFNNMDEMLSKITNANFEIIDRIYYTTKYKLKIKVTDKILQKDLYLVQVEMKYGKSNDDVNKKEIYINR